MVVRYLRALRSTLTLLAICSYGELATIGVWVSWHRVARGARKFAEQCSAVRTIHELSIIQGKMTSVPGACCPTCL